MLNWLTSVPTRVKDLLVRNKYKLVGTGVAAGAVWYYYGDTLKQAWQMYQLMQSLQAEAGPAHTHETSSEEDVSYRQTVQTGDETSQKHFQSIRAHRTQLYSDEIDWLQQELRKSPANDEEKSKREQLFDRLCLMCFSRLVTSVALTYVLLLVARIEVCLIGRANHAEVDDDAKADHRELLSGLRSVVSNDVVERIDSISRRVVKEVFTIHGIAATTSLKQAKLDEVMNAISEHVVEEMRGESHFGGLLGKLATGNDQSTICKQTLDVLEAPQFKLVLSHMVKQGVRLSVSRSVPDGTKSAFPLAILIAGIRAEAETVTTPNGPHVDLLRDSPVVDEFGRAVYQASSAPDVEDIALMQQLAGQHDPGSAQLGDLLERLVKADLKK